MEKNRAEKMVLKDKINNERNKDKAELLQTVEEA